jgi:hypothetical protein
VGGEQRPCPPAGGHTERQAEEERDARHGASLPSERG